MCMGEDGKPRLIDFNFCTKYLDAKGKHLPVIDVPFRSNVQTSSRHAMSCQRTSRRDDLVSLIFVVIILCKPCRHPFMRHQQESDDHYFNRMKLEKEMSPWLIVDLKGLYWFRSLASDLGAIKYEAEPHYSKFEFALKYIVYTEQRSRDQSESSLERAYFYDGDENEFQELDDKFQEEELKMGELDGQRGRSKLRK